MEIKSGHLLRVILLDGPYLTKIPANRRNGLDSIEIDGTLGGGNCGWHYNTTTGEFHADTDQDSDL